MNTLKTLITSTFIAVAGFAFSQSTVGFKAGLNTGNFSLEDNEMSENVAGMNTIGFETGLFLEKRFANNNLYFRPEVLYTYRYGQAEGRSNSGLTTHRVELPFMFGVQIAGPLSIEAGPSYQYMLYFDQGFAPNAEVNNNSLVGYRVGPSLNFGRFTTYANFQGSIFSFGPGSSNYTEPFRINAGLAINLGTCGK